MEIKLQPLGDMVLQVTFGDTISESIHREIRSFISGLQRARIKGIIEWVPAYASVAIYYLPEVISYTILVEKIETIYNTSYKMESSEALVYEIPVYYGGETGPDLSFVSQYQSLSEEEVIALHANNEYLIYMMGFVPGFPYLGGLAPKLAVPRLEHPRSSVLAGSVGIGGNQTGIYPSKVPSGWRIIGITPIKLFDIENPTPFLLCAGNYLKFIPIDFNENLRIKQLVDEKKYSVSTYRKGEGCNHEIC